jgi:outer membrane beta-barrel protein
VVVPQVDRRDVRLPRYPSNDLEMGLYCRRLRDRELRHQLGLRRAGRLPPDRGLLRPGRVCADQGHRRGVPADPAGGIFESKTQKLNYYNLSVGYNILPGEVFLFSSRARPSQFYIIGGVGSTKFVDQRKPTFNVGFGFKVFITDYASWQLDLRDHIFTLDLLGKSQSTQNVELTTGLSFYF